MRLKIILLLLLFNVFLTFCSKEPNTPDPPSDQKELRLVRTFDTWTAGIIKSTDPAGLTYHEPSNHLFISDSEINEIDTIWACENIFEISLAGDAVFNTFDAYSFSGDSCPASNRREPAGITYSTFDGFFYIVNDNENLLLRYNAEFESPPLDSVHIPGDLSTATDPEGITCDPNTGNLYIASGQSGVVPQVLVYSPQLVLISNFSVEGIIRDPQGIVYCPLTNHLFIVDSVTKIIFEFTLGGEYVDEFDISSFPGIRSPQGLAFAPSSDPTDDPNLFNLYIADGQVDNSSNTNDLDGRVYEAVIFSPANIVLNVKLYPNFPNPFTTSTTITP